MLFFCRPGKGEDDKDRDGKSHHDLRVERPSRMAGGNDQPADHRRNDADDPHYKLIDPHIFSGFGRVFDGIIDQKEIEVRRIYPV